jgi:hypothetical protein
MAMMWQGPTIVEIVRCAVPDIAVDGRARVASAQTANCALGGARGAAALGSGERA